MKELLAGTLSSANHKNQFSVPMWLVRTFTKVWIPANRPSAPKNSAFGELYSPLSMTPFPSGRPVTKTQSTYQLLWNLPLTNPIGSVTVQTLHRTCKNTLARTTVATKNFKFDSF